jgi:hypothetical protein
MNTSGRHHLRDLPPPFPSSPLPFLFISSGACAPQASPIDSTCRHLFKRAKRWWDFIGQQKGRQACFAFRRVGGAGHQSLVLPPFGAKLQRRVRELQRSTRLYSVATRDYVVRKEEANNQG